MRTPVPLARICRSLMLPLVAAPLALAVASAPAAAQDDFDEDELVDADEDFTDEPSGGDDKPKKVDLGGDDDDGGDTGDVAVADDAPPTKQAEKAEDALPDFDAVRPVDRERGDMPLIQNKLFPTQFRFELGGVFDYSYSDKFVQHVGGHVSAAFHILDWVAVEGWVGGFYPRELPITRTVRQVGYSFTNLRIDPQLGDLWQSFAFAGAGVQWAPVYGKFSMFSELDLSFQLYFVGGFTVEAIAKPQSDAGGTTINNQKDFYPGLISGVNYAFMARPSATYGAGVRLMPWKWVAFKIEFRNFTGINPPAEGPNVGPGIDTLFDLTNLPMVNLGISILVP